MFRSSLPSRSALQITGAGLLWGTTGVVVQLVHQYTGLSPVALGFYRLAIAAVVMLAFAATRSRTLLTAFRSAPLLMILIGGCLGAYHALFFLAVAMSGVAVATFVSLGLAPLLIAGWEALRTHRLPSRAIRYGLAGAVTGLALISGLGSAPTGAAPRPLLGLVTAIGSGLGFAVTTVLSRHVADRVRPVELTTMSVTIGGLVLAPVAALDGGFGFPAGPVPVGMLIYLGAVTTAVAYALFYAGLRTTPGSVATVLTLLEPLTAAVLAVTVLGEPLSLPGTAGGALLLAAVLTAQSSALTDERLRPRGASVEPGVRT